ncbi:MAG: DUF2339 domain-containing protein [Burkholderiales bacterium]|nr:DUF2339 domain-containing protein [Burkholderiales bacterium]
MYRYDEFDAGFVAERVSAFRAQVERRLAGEGAPARGEEAVAPAPAPVVRLEAAPPAAIAPAPAESPQAERPAQPPPLPPRTAPAPEPVASATPAAPAEDLAGRLWAWFTGGNTVVRVGVVVLFFGVAFLLKYAYEHARVPVELRLAGVAAGAIALLGLGWRLRGTRPGYALALQGGGVGILYLTIFAALRLYGLLPPAAALVLLAGVAAASAALAVLQDSRSLAILGVSGGFLAPVLASTGGGSHVMLFSYYALLNAGILAVAWHKAWRSLNVIGFVFTFVIAALWGGLFYRPEHFATTEPFLVLFFLFYVAIPILFARREAPRIAGYLDGTLVFGVPIVAFGLQLALVRDFEYGAAWSAAALGAFYVALAWTVHRRAAERLAMLVEAFLALGIGFATLAIPLAFEGRWTAAAWAVEGAALVWVGVRQDRRLARLFGAFLQFAAGLALVSDEPAAARLAILNADFLGVVLLAGSGLFSSWYLGRRAPGDRFEDQAVPAALFAWGALWWAGGGLREIDRFVREPLELAAGLAFLAVSCAAFSFAARRLDWPLAARAALAITPLMVAAAAFAVGEVAHPFAMLGFVAWPLAFAAHFLALARHEDAFPGWAAAAHAVGLWVFAALASWELAWWIDRLVAGRAVWGLVAWAIAPALVLAFLALRADRIAWPFAKHLRAYALVGAAPLAGYLVAWTLFANAASNGNPAPLPYVPLLNPLDLAQAGALLTVATWLAEVRRRNVLVCSREAAASAYAALGVAAFVWANGVLLRTLHHYAHVPFALDAMLRSMLVQAAFSIFWTVLALGAMVTATRSGLRPLWLAGAGLMAVVVAKLFLFDLANIGGVERIVSFIAVGLLMLVIGYFSPVPPKTKEDRG